MRRSPGSWACRGKIAASSARSSANASCSTNSSATSNLSDHVKAHPGALDPRSVTLASYALCGFANFSSIAIQIGGIGALAPERRRDLARLGLRAQ